MENSNFGTEYNDKYLVVVDGNQVVFSHCNKKPALRRFHLRSFCRHHYVELWRQYSNGRCVLLNYAN